MSTRLDELRHLLQRQSPGAVPCNVLDVLAQAWDELKGSSETSMEDYKLQRAENIVWDPPVLSFGIERHGRTVQGSSRAELQQWTVDVDKGTVTQAKSGHRQLKPMDKRLDCNALACELRDKILAGEEDQRLAYRSDGVKVKISETVNANNKRTLADRRRRFRKAMSVHMKEVGWAEVKLYLYQRVSDTGDEEVNGR